MTITKLFIYIGIFALIVLVSAMVSGKSKNPIVNWIQFFVGGLFIFSGFIKAIDPVGTAIKMEEYFEVFVEYTPALTGFWHFWAEHALATGIIMIILEIFLGITLFFGKYKKLTLWALILIIVFFTFLTGFSHFTGKVTDCGCFGDFMKLTPYQSFMKDIFLLVMVAILYVGRKHIAPFFREGSGNIVIGLLTLLTIWFTYSNYFNLPDVDFRAYKVGTNIPDCTQLPEGAKQYIYETTFIYKNKASGEEKEFVNSFPEDFSAWDYVDRKDKMIQKGEDPKCKDFSISDEDGNDVTAELMEEDFLVILSSFDLSRSKYKGFERLRDVAVEADRMGVRVVGLTGSSLDEAEALRHELGLPIQFYNLDAVPIKTMNRANPGLVILGRGTVLGKWHHRKVKTFEKIRSQVEIIDD